MRMNTSRRTISRAALLVYVAVMLLLLLHRERAAEALPYLSRVKRHLNMVPLRTIRRYINLLSAENISLRGVAAVNLVGNVLLFVPFGFLPPASFAALRTWPRVLGVAALSLIAVELLQALLLVGACDVDDLLLNLIGTALGYTAFTVMRTHL